MLNYYNLFANNSRLSQSSEIITIPKIYKKVIILWAESRERERLAHPNEATPIYNEAPECLHSSSIIVSFWSVIHSVRGFQHLEEEVL